MTRRRPTQNLATKPSAPTQPQEVAIAQQWSGPLPPPAALEHFNQIIPNGAERILALVEREQEHRIEHDNQSLKAAIADTKRAHWIGGAISLAAIGSAVFAVGIGAHPTVSISLVGLPIAAIVQAIIKGRAK